MAVLKLVSDYRMVHICLHGIKARWKAQLAGSMIIDLVDLESGKIFLIVHKFSMILLNGFMYKITVCYIYIFTEIRESYLCCNNQKYQYEICQMI